MSKTNELEEIQQTLQEIFLSNLEYFKTNHHNIYKKIIDFDKLNIENFSIEFIDNHFELINIKNHEKLYNQDPFFDAKTRVNNFDISNAFALIKLEPYEKKTHYTNEINAYEFINDYIKGFGNQSKIDIKKFVFIGTLLGVHINDFHNLLKSDVYLIIEEDIEIFKLSMFMTDYKTISKDSKLFFVINESQNNFNLIVEEFLSYKKEFNNLIHFELAHETNHHLINNLSLLFTQSSQMRYPFSEYLLSLKRGFKYFQKSQNKIINLSRNNDFLGNKKIIFLGAGVSLAKNIEWLYLNRNNFIIVASSAVLKHLEILDIHPDIIILIDGQKDCMLNQFKVKKSFYENSIILASIKIDEELFDNLENKNCFFMQNSLELFDNYGYLSGVTVGDIGINILYKLGAKELYLLGVDASIDSKTGKTHIGTHQSSRKVNLNNTDSNNINFQKNIVYVKGNFQKEVPTFLEYCDMIENVNIQVKHLKIKIFNLGDGAYFENTIPLKPENFDNSEIKEIDKQEFKQEFFENLKSIAKTSLNEKDKKDILKEKKILLKLQNMKSPNFYKDFLNIKRNFEHSIIINILDKYFDLVNPYFNFLNSTQKANEIMEKQLKIILNEFNSIYATINDKI
jgi:hypothetical protein